MNIQKKCDLPQSELQSSFQLHKSILGIINAITVNVYAGNPNLLLVSITSVMKT